MCTLILSVYFSSVVVDVADDTVDNNSFNSSQTSLLIIQHKNSSRINCWAIHGWMTSRGILHLLWRGLSVTLHHRALLYICRFSHVFSADTGTSLGEMLGPSKAINAVGFKPSRPFRIAVASEDQSVYFYQGPPFKLAQTLTVRTVLFGFCFHCVVSRYCQLLSIYHTIPYSTALVNSKST